VKDETQVQTEAQKQNLTTILEELESLHATEAVALRRLARDEIDELTDRKEALWAQLRETLQNVRPEPEHRALLERIKRAALHNQILLMHARDAVRTVLQTASGQSLSPPSTRAAAVQDGMRVDFRG
jgi:flagellar biosynthesis/type III secretory pathway chaperone